MEVGERGLKMANVLLAVVEVEKRGSGNVTTQHRNWKVKIVPDQVLKPPNAEKYLAQVYKTANAN